jgi:hypothetical protein
MTQKWYHMLRQWHELRECLTSSHTANHKFVQRVCDRGCALPSDVWCRRYDAEVEAGLDEAYRTFLQRHKKREAALQAKRARLGLEGELPQESDGSDDEEKPATVTDEGFEDFSDGEKVSIPYVKVRNLEIGGIGAAHAEMQWHGPVGRPICQG